MESYKLSADYLLQQIGKDTVLLPCGEGNDVDFSKMIVLNGTGAAIVSQMVDTFVTVDEVIAKIKAEYQNISENLEDDVNAFISEMKANGLVTTK